MTSEQSLLQAVLKGAGIVVSSRTVGSETGLDVVDVRIASPLCGTLNSSPALTASLAHLLNQAGISIDTIHGNYSETEAQRLLDQRTAGMVSYYEGSTSEPRPTGQLILQVPEGMTREQYVEHVTNVLAKITGKDTKSIPYAGHDASHPQDYMAFDHSFAVSSNEQREDLLDAKAQELAAGQPGCEMAEVPGRPTVLAGATHGNTPTRA